MQCRRRRCPAPASTANSSATTPATTVVRRSVFIRPPLGRYRQCRSAASGPFGPKGAATIGESTDCSGAASHGIAQQRGRLPTFTAAARRLFGPSSIAASFAEASSRSALSPRSPVRRAARVSRARPLPTRVSSLGPSAAPAAVRGPARDPERGRRKPLITGPLFEGGTCSNFVPVRVSVRVGTASGCCARSFDSCPPIASCRCTTRSGELGGSA